MSRAKLYIILIVFILSSLFSCGVDPYLAGGSASEGEAKAVVTGIVVDREALPISGQTVTLKKVVMNIEGGQESERLNDETDDNGEYRFEDVPEGDYVIYCQDTDNSSLALCSKVSVSGDTLIENDALVLQPTAVLIGRIMPRSGFNFADVQVVIPATSVQADVDMSGIYILTGVPLGSLDIGFIYGNTANYLPVMIKNVTEDTIFIKDVSFALNDSEATGLCNFYDGNFERSYYIIFEVYGGSEPQWYLGKDFLNVRYFRPAGNGELVEVDDDARKTLLVDDFDDGDALSNLNESGSGSSCWYSYDDSDLGGNSHILPPEVRDDFTAGLIDSGGYKGKSFHAVVILGNAIEKPFAGIGCVLSSEQKKYADLTQLMSIRFFMKGRGVVRLQFVSRRATEGYSQDELWGQLGTEIDSYSYWGSKTINFTEIVTPSGSKQEADSLAWEDVRDSVERVEFQVVGNPGDTLEIFLDDFYLNGLTKELIY